MREKCDMRGRVILHEREREYYKGRGGVTGGYLWFMGGLI